MTDFAIGDLKGSTRVSKRVPLKRIGQTEDIAASIQFLCGRGVHISLGNTACFRWNKCFNGTEYFW